MLRPNLCWNYVNKSIVELPHGNSCVYIDCFDITKPVTQLSTVEKLPIKIALLQKDFFLEFRSVCHKRNIMHASPKMQTKFLMILVS